MLTATYKDRVYEITSEKIGTTNHKGTVSLAGLPLATWCATGCGPGTIEEALEIAHKRAEALGLETIGDH